jgi:Fur family ferric uptake transcriptional regulator
MKIDQLIEEKKLKLTSARKEPLEIFNRYHKPLSYDDVKDHISMDKTTFYRNVSKFEQEDILSSFESNDKKRYYEFQEKPHAHFICTSCNSIECLPDLKVPNIEGYKIVDAVYKGLCESCNQESRDALQDERHNTIEANVVK